MKEYKYKINGNEYNVAIIDIDGDTAAVEVNGVSYKVDILSETFTPASPQSVAPAQQPVVQPTVQTQPQVSPQPQPVVQPQSQPEASQTISSATGKPIQSPLPGVIIDIKVNVGDQVKVGQTVAVLEAMKMENAINSEIDGVVTAIKVNKGDSILEGSDIVLIG